MQVRKIDTVIVGAGQAGLSISRLLKEQNRDHIILEKNSQIAESWRNRWDSFTLVTPNWQLKLPGYAYQGENPDGFLPRDEVVRYLEGYAESFNPPIRFETPVTAVEKNGTKPGGLVYTVDDTYEAEHVVVAAGTFQRPNFPECSSKVPEEITQLHSSEYRNPDMLPDGNVLVVGSGQSGSQIAQELHESGRKVYLATSKVGRLPRRYRGEDGMWWAVKLGMTERTVDQLDSPEERFAPNPKISGKNGGTDINLHQFARDGVTLLGRVQDIRDRKAILVSDLHDNLAFADTMASEFYKGVDKYVEKTGLSVPEESVEELRDGYEQEQLSELHLDDHDIRTVLWATGFRWDYSWIQPLVLDQFGYPKQERGVSEYPGLYFLGIHWMHSLKSGLFLGVGEDAAYVAEHIDGRS